MAYLDRIHACKIYQPANYVPFTVGGRQVGLVHKKTLPNLAANPDVIEVSPDRVTLSDRWRDYRARSSAMRDVCQNLREQGLVHAWRDEPYAVRERWGQPALLEIERGTVPLFGVEGYGVHLNGVVETPNGPNMWIGRRSKTKPTGPGKLDQIVAGGLPSNLGVFENLIKESREEADIPADLASQAVPIGIVSYCTETTEGLRRDVLFNYDLALPEAFTPHNTDGEIDDFYLWTMHQVIRTVRDTDEFKFNCAIIVIDFLIRRGFIKPDEPDYVSIIHGLHRN
ncbi:MAG: DUF4743 domain-containing protein [Rhodospirillaceae bacterium]